jgi:hypothetical protein
MCIPQLLALSRIQHIAPPQSTVLGVAMVHLARGSTILYAACELCLCLYEEVLQQMQELWEVP